MYTTSTAYKTEIQKRSRTFECRVTIGDRVFTNNEVQSIDLNGGIQDVFSIGNTPSMCLELVLRNTTDTIFTTNSVKVEIGLKIGNTIEYIPLGIFNIEDIKKDDYTTKFTCYDNMTKFEIAYFSSLGDKPTLQQVVNELASKTGVQFTGSLPSYTVKKLEGFTCREVLGYVASLCGGNALITRDGEFTIVYPTDISRDVGEGVFDLQRDEVKYKVGKITCQIKEQETISKGSLGTDSMELSFENPWVTETILTDIYNRLNGFNYLGYTMKWQGDLSLDIGDIITYTDAKKVTRKLPILYRKLSYDGGLDSELSAKGETKNKNSFNSSGSMSNKLNRVVTEVAIVNKAFIDYANINDANIKNLQVETAKIHNLEVETANINNILAGNIGSGSIQTIHLTGKNVVIDNAVIKSAMIDSLDLSKLNAGTISTNKFRITSDNGGIEIVGATQQFKDKNNKVRIQMGQDTQGNFNFILRGADGTTTLIDHTGIKEKAIADDLIKSNMVAADAIGEKQINYSSLITGLNKDDNTSLIKASKVAIDLTGQSLEVAFSSLKSNVEAGNNNYYRYTNFDSSIMPKGTVGWWSSNGATGDVEILEEPTALSKKKIKITFTKAGMAGHYFKPWTDAILPTVGTYTLSAWFRGKAGTSIEVMDEGQTTSGIMVNLTEEWVKVSRIFIVPEGSNMLTNPKAVHFYKTSTTGQGEVGDWFEYHSLKLEKGDKATEWCNNERDIDSITTSLQTQINTNIKGIETLVKDTTIKQGDSTVKLQDFYSSFIQTKGEISQKVTQAEIDSSINKIKIGSTNLLRNTGIEKDTSYFSLANGVTRDTSVKCLGTNTFKYDISGSTVDVWRSANPTPVDVVEGEQYSASGYINIASAAINNTATFQLEIQWYDASGKRILTNNVAVDRSIRNKWQLIKCEGKVAPVGAVKANCRIWVQRNGMCWVGRLQLEKGTKCSDWSSSPRDTEQRVNSVEQKITATAITTTITEAINAGTNSFTTMQFVLDKNGATIKNGALRILNKAEEEVLKGDSNGNLTMSGVYINRSASTGLKAVEINNTNIYLYDWDRADKRLGIICSTYATNTPTAKGLTIGHFEECYSSLDYSSDDGTYHAYISFDKYNIRGRTGLYTYYPINVHEKLAFSDSTVFDAASRFHYGVSLYNGYNGTFPLGYFTTATNNATYLCSHEKLANPLYLGVYNNDAESLTGILKVQYGIPTSSVTVYGNLTCTGTKPRTVSTTNFGMRELYAYETATPMFSDRGRGSTDEKGKCYIYLDTIFKETVSDSTEYDVFLQKYGKGELDITEMTRDYFLVEGTPNLKFAWIIDCIQKGYEDCRLAQSDVDEVPPYDFGKDSLVFEDDEDYGEIGYKYIENYEKELLVNG